MPQQPPTPVTEDATASAEELQRRAAADYEEQQTRQRAQGR
ncbi:hypothetical protein [Streptomyces liangshanensis]